MAGYTIGSYNSPGYSIRARLRQAGCPLTSHAFASFTIASHSLTSYTLLSHILASYSVAGYTFASYPLACYTLSWAFGVYFLTNIFEKYENQLLRLGCRKDCEISGREALFLQNLKNSVARARFKCPAVLRHCLVCAAPHGMMLILILLVKFTLENIFPFIICHLPSSSLLNVKSKKTTYRRW